MYIRVDSWRRAVDTVGTYRQDIVGATQKLRLAYLMMKTRYYSKNSYTSPWLGNLALAINWQNMLEKIN